MVHVFCVSSEIDAEYTRIGIRSQVGLYIIYQSAAFTECQVQAAVHAGSSQYIIEQIESGSFFIVCMISPAAYHDMCLVGVFVDGQCLWNIGKGSDTLTVCFAQRYIAYSFFYCPDYLLEIDIALHKKDHVGCFVEACCKLQRISAGKLSQEFRFSQNISS